MRLVIGGLLVWFGLAGCGSKDQAKSSTKQEDTRFEVSEEEKKLLEKLSKTPPKGPKL